MTNIYTDNGYSSREEYLQTIAEEFDTDIEVVKSLANLLGENEDFDGLISALECDW